MAHDFKDITVNVQVKQLNKEFKNLGMYQMLCARSLQSCLTLRNPTDCSLQGSSVRGIL